MKQVTKLKPEEVFTPRSAQVNPGMYVDRPDLERQIRNALSGQKNIILYGESGNGKTWLYNRVFESKGAVFTVLNLGYAKFHEDLVPVIRDKLGEMKISQESDVKNEVKAGFMPQGMGAQVTTTTTTTNIQKSDILELFKSVRLKAGSSVPAVLVLDNFEQIQDIDVVVRQIAGLLILLDDPMLAAYSVKIMVVGVPGDIKTLIGKISNASTIANRVTEIDEVERLSLDQSIELMRRGFEQKLDLKFDVDTGDTYNKIAWVTDRIAQHIHELCLSIARCAVEFSDGRVNKDVLDQALEDWLKESLASDYAVIEQHMNSRETKVGRKNQTLYALGECDAADFKNKDIEQIVRAKFPNSTKDVLLDIPGMMSKFSSADNPVLRRAKKEDAYRFVSPKYRMVIRTMMELSLGERVLKRALNR